MKYTTLLLIALLFSCKEKQVVQEESLYVIDTNVEIKKNLKASDIFKKVTPIILEEHDDALIGKVSGMEVHKNYIFILDAWKASKLLVYSKDGKYLTQIGRLGLGPGEYISVRDFCINDDLGEIYLLDNRSKKIHKYKLHTWEYISSINLGQYISYAFMAYSANKIYMSLCYYDLEQSDNMLCEIDLKTNKTKEYISAQKYNFGYNTINSGNSNFFASKNKNDLKYTQLYMNTVFAIDNEDVYPYITIKSDNWVTKKDYLAAEKELEEQGMPKDDVMFVFIQKKLSFEIFNYLEWGNNIYLQYNHEYEDGAPSVLYNKDKKEYNICNHFLNDFLFTQGERFMTKFAYANSEFAYDILGSYRMTYFVENVKNGEIVLSPDIDKREELMNLNDEQIVVFEYEFK